MAQQVALTIKENDTLGDVHSRFACRYACPLCSAKYVCPCRDRATDIKLIWSFLSGGEE
jgi:hypothetical protein